MIDWDEFERLTPHILAALEYNGGEQSLADVKAGLASGDFQLWPGRNSMIVTEYFETPTNKFLNFFLAAGELDELADMVAPIERWAKNRGVTKITLYGRKGWERSFMKELGYRTHWVVMTKDL
jgi:uncharacterized protein (DUF2384 family)